MLQPGFRKTVLLAPIWAAVLVIYGLGFLAFDDPSVDTSVANESDLSLVPASTAGFGVRACQDCHADEVRAWGGSHHDLAMDEASEETVLGSFDDASVMAAGESFHFYRKGQEFWVDVEAANGSVTALPISFVFGVTPLQQYLVRGEGGRLQALPAAWDTRPAEEGGGRWFDLYEGEVFLPGEAIHWSGRGQTWNTMCAACHSSGLTRDFDMERRAFETRWNEIDVGCSACHGVEPHPGGPPEPGSEKNAGPGAWAFAEEAHTAHWTGAPRGDREIELCAPCHSRRSQLDDSFTPSDRFLDRFEPSLVNGELYHLDGQVKEEVFVYGSFLQSAMYQAGVTCSDCHDVHTLKPVAEGNALCGQCHDAGVFDRENHHRHKEGTDGALCVNCHMPERLFMGVDERRDHSIRVPNPGLAKRAGAPDACTDCHEDRDQSWAQEAYEQFGWTVRTNAFAEAMLAASKSLANAGPLLSTLVGNEETAPILRGAAAEELGRLGRADMSAALAALGSPDDLVRLGAARGFALTPDLRAIGPLTTLLDDPLKAVRFQAAWALAPLPRDRLSPEGAARLGEVLLDLIEAEKTKAERPEALVNIGLAQLYLSNSRAAEEALKMSLATDPQFVAGPINLADLYRQMGRDEEAVGVLTSALEEAPNNAQLRFSLGLALVRRGEAGQALDHLRRAAEAQPPHPRYTYVYAVALHSSGDLGGAMAVLEGALAHHGSNSDLLYMAVVTADGLDRADAVTNFGMRFLEQVPDGRQAAGVRALMMKHSPER